MPKCKFNKITKLQSNFIEIRLRHGCSPINLLHIFRRTFPKNTSRWLLLMLSTLSAINRLPRCSFLAGLHPQRGHWFHTGGTVLLAQVILLDSQREEQVHSLINSVALAQEKNSEACISRIFSYSTKDLDLTENYKDLPVISLKIKMNAIIFPGRKQILQKGTRQYPRNIGKSLPEYLILQGC